MSFWTPVENPGTRPLRSWVFDIGCALLAALASFGTLFLRPDGAPAHPPLAVSLVVAVLTALVAVAAPGLARPGVRRRRSSWRRCWPSGRSGARCSRSRSAIALYTVARHDEPGDGARRGRRSRRRPRSPRPARAAGTTAGWP